MRLIDLVDGLLEEDAKAIGAALGPSARDTLLDLSTRGPPLKYHDICQGFQSALDTSSSSEDLEQALKSLVQRSIGVKAGEDRRNIISRAFAATLLNIGLHVKQNTIPQANEYIIDVKLIDDKLHMDPASGNKMVPKSIKDLFEEGDAAIQALYALQSVMKKKDLPKGKRSVRSFMISTISVQMISCMLILQ